MNMMFDAAQLQTSFVRETRELLEEANEALLALEADPANPQAINGLFRAVHSIKGSAGLFELPALIHMVHAAEDLLGTIREGAMRIDSSITDDLLAGLDLVGNWISQFEAAGALQPECMAIARDYARRYRARLGQSQDIETAPAAGNEDVLPDWIDGPALSEIEAAAAAVEGPVTLVRYAPGEDCFFAGEDPFFLAIHTPGTLWLKIAPREAWDSSEAFDPYRCNLVFLIATDAPRDEIEHRFRYVPDDVAIAALPSEAKVDSVATSTEHSLPPLAREILDVQRTIVEADPAGHRAPAVARTIRNLITACERHETLTDESPAALKLCLDRLLGTASPAAAAADELTTAASGESQAEKTLRVDQSKVDAMMNLVGELIVAKNALPFLARDAETKFGSRELGREIKDKYAVIDRIAQEMQGAIMGIRMLPVSDLFRRFPRLVRDIARKLEKQVQLQIEGEATRADKNIIEALSEPLTHVIRNSLDHGIELPADRRAAGKPESATIRLKAAQVGDNVIIEIHDDGRGIDPDRVRAKAIAKGLIDAERGGQLSDGEAVQLVFLPGFSTAEQISDLSGRGVGMDAVRTAVERQGGSVQLESELGRGTIIRLKLPLSMAVTRVLTIDIAGQSYGVPMDMVVETVRIARTSLRRIKSAEAVVLRDRVIPVVRLRNLLGMDARAADQESVLILDIEGTTIGMIVDDFGTGMDIILKPFAGILAAMAGFAGTAVLGDGKVLLVLNLKEIL